MKGKLVSAHPKITSNLRLVDTEIWSLCHQAKGDHVCVCVSNKLHSLSYLQHWGEAV